MTDDALGESQFRGLYKEFTTAFENEEYDALRKLFVPTAVMINPVGNVLSGRDAVVNFLQRAQRIQSVRFEALDAVRLSTDIVRHVGDLSLTMRAEGRDTREVSGKFLIVWTKVDGDWRIDSCVWCRQGGGQNGRNQAGGGRQGGVGGRMGGGGGVRQGGGGGGRQGGGMRGGRMGVRGLGPDEGGAFNPRNIHRDDLAPMVPRID